MTFSAHVIPVLLAAGPEQRVARPDVFVRIEVIPALAALFDRARIPGEWQRLYVPVRKLDKTLKPPANAPDHGWLACA